MVQCSYGDLTILDWIFFFFLWLKNFKSTYPLCMSFLIVTIFVRIETQSTTATTYVETQSNTKTNQFIVTARHSFKRENRSVLLLQLETEYDTIRASFSQDRLQPLLVIRKMTPVMPSGSSCCFNISFVCISHQNCWAVDVPSVSPLWSNL